MLFHMVNLCATQADKLFAEFRKENPDAIARQVHFNATDFRLATARQLTGIALNAQPPMAPKKGKEAKVAQRYPHLRVVGKRCNCRYCAKKRGKKHVKTAFTCSHCKGPTKKPVNLCLNDTRNCFTDYHSAKADDIRL
eukprot:scpid95883/ scgid30684/ 